MSKPPTNRKTDSSHNKVDCVHPLDTAAHSLRCTLIAVANILNDYNESAHTLVRPHYILPVLDALNYLSASAISFIQRHETAHSDASSDNV